MENRKIEWADLPLTVHLATFRPSSGTGVAEHHATIVYNDPFDIAATQFANIEKAIGRLQKDEPGCARLVFKRYFLSDAVGQAEYPAAGRADEGETAVSVVGQPPLNGTKASVWLYFTEGVPNPAYEHLFSTRLRTSRGSEDAQTLSVFENYSRILERHGCTLKENCIRTWIYVQGIDLHYAGMVKARTAFFEKEGLTRDTHYIASTGIEGRSTDTRSLVMMDAYGIGGISRDQVRYLHAPGHLSPTHKYGVTFERGTSVDYGDRRHIFISGTASIDHRGEIVHPGDVIGQTRRMFANIGALLAKAGAGFDDIAQMTVYLRDTADNALVSEYVEKHCPGIPRVVVLAPVCRPGWLVEAECIALKEIEDGRFHKF